MGAMSTGREKEGWRLTFEDDFDGEELDLTKWSRLPDGKRRDGYWSGQEAFLDGKGHLIIQTSERDGEYYSGALNTRGKFEQAYGYYEIRAQLPKEEGFWTAFWLMADGVGIVGNEGRDGTEIDIYESAYPKEDKIQHALHWDGYGEHHKSAGYAPYIPGIYEGFHTFALQWDEDEYIFYVDGEETWRTSAGGVSEVPSFLKVTAEVGTWAGDIRKAKLPAQLIVDYVRVYERIQDIVIESPARRATVAADEPVRIQVNPDIDMAEIRVIQNGVEIYAGSSIPDELALVGPVSADDGEDTLLVIVTDKDGQVWEKETEFQVSRAFLRLPDQQKKRVQGALAVESVVAMAADEHITCVTLSLHPIYDGKRSDAITLYEGRSGPGVVVLGTLDYDEGAYDLQLIVETDQGNISTDEQRIVIHNWDRLTEDFPPPASFFGAYFDRLKTTERSDGWSFASDNAEDFFGDEQRIVSSGERDEYLIWKQPRLRHFELVIYVKDETLLDFLDIATSTDLEDWHSVDYEAAVVDRSPAGWLQMSLGGEIEEGQETDYLRVTLRAHAGDMQLGSVELTGVAGN
jgi:beta-glucanase (GH16 family)